jgi:tetratricopeptide (TPR) repeat protein
MAKAKKQRRPAPVGRNHHTSAAPRLRPELLWSLAIVIAAVVVYVNAIGNEFVLDDTRIIRDNVRIRSLANIPGLFASSYWGTAGTQGLYRPLVLVSYAANYAVHGLSTAGYTIVNIVLHAGVSLLLFVLVRGIGGSLLASGVAAMAFAIHPVHTEAVAGIAGRTELLAAFFFLLAMHFHRRAPAAERSTLFRAATAACFACALLSKESAITLVLVLPVMDAVVPAKRRDGQALLTRARILTDYLPLIAVALAYLALRRAVLGGIVISEGVIAPLDNPLVPLTTTALGERMGATTGQALMTASAVVVEYARMLAWPARLSPDYSYNQIPLVTRAADVRFITGMAIVASCLGGIVLLWRRSPLAAFGLAFLALTYSIVSNFAVTIGTICAERLMYLPSAGALIAAATGVERLTTRAGARRRIAYVVLAALLMTGAARTWTRNRDWKSDFSLWSAAIAVAPGSARVQSEHGRVLMNLGDNAAQAGRTADAERYYASAQSHFETALKIYPSYSPPMDGLATILSVHQRFDEALVWYERAVKVWPASYASVTNWAGLLWDRSRRMSVQASELRAAGKTAEADALTRQADAGFREAIEKVDVAISMNPSYAHAHLIRALLMVAYVGDHEKAIAEFEEVLRLMPDHPQRGAIEQELARLRSQQ